MSETPLLDWRAPYPISAGAKSRETSFRAAHEMEPRLDLLRAKVLRALKDLGPMTADEVAAAIGETPFATRPRLSEAASRSKIKDTGERRRNDSGRNAIVWEITA